MHEIIPKWLNARYVIKVTWPQIVSRLPSLKQINERSETSPRFFPFLVSAPASHMVISYVIMFHTHTHTHTRTLLWIISQAPTVITLQYFYSLLLSNGAALTDPELSRNNCSLAVSARRYPNPPGEAPGLFSFLGFFFFFHSDGKTRAV